jgi:DNA-binding NarL/FixJ family response regulator
MQSASIILLQSDPIVAQLLAASLSNSFRGVHLAKSVVEVRQAAAKTRADAIIVDLESATLADVEALKQEFASIRIICNHRVADEEMWTRTLTAGADDCCSSYDMRAILLSAVRDHAAARSMAAA